MKSTIFSFGTMVLLGTFAMVGCSDSDLKIGAAKQSGNYFKFAESLSEQLKADGEFKVKVMETSGSATNVRQLNNNNFQLAFAQNDVAYDAYHAVGIFRGGFEMNAFSAVAGLYTEACHVIVRADSNINKISDLSGKKVSVGELHSGTEKNALQILEPYNLADSYKITQFNLSYDDSIQAIKNKKIDAFFVTLAVNDNLIKKLSNELQIKVLPVENDKVEKIIDNYTYYSPYTIPAGTYKGQTEDVNTVGIKSLLLVSNNLSDDDVYKITSIFFKNSGKYGDILPKNYSITPENASKNVSVPFHKGASRYYAEKGILVPTDYK